MRHIIVQGSLNMLDHLHGLPSTIGLSITREIRYDQIIQTRADTGSVIPNKIEVHIFVSTVVS